MCFLGTSCLLLRIPTWTPNVCKMTAQDHPNLPKRQVCYLLVGSRFVLSTALVVRAQGESLGLGARILGE